MKVKGADAIAGAISELLAGEAISEMQVLGPNSLKTLIPLSAVSGENVTAVSTDEGIVVIETLNLLIRVDLQRAAVLQKRGDAVAWTHAEGNPMPTVRFVTRGFAIDLTEPAKTKRIAVWLQSKSS